MAEDITVEILKDIRDELRTTRTELKAEIAETRAELSERVGAVEQRVGAVDDRVGGLERRQSEMELRLATEIVAVVGAIHEVRDVLKDTLALAPRVADHELRLRALEASSPRRE